MTETPQQRADRLLQEEQQSRRIDWRPQVPRHTRLHAALWGPYKITAHPHGIDGPEPECAPAWEPDALVISNGYACRRSLGHTASLEAAMDACWAHYASLPR